MRALRHVSPAVLTLLASVTLASAGFAQGAYQVADLTVEPYPTPGLLFPPTSVEELSGVGYFLHDDGIHGWELWRSDGTAIGTYLVRDICPGRCGSLLEGSIFGVKTSAGRIFFAADDGIHGTELWVTDGTALGTQLVRDILPGARSSAPGWFADASGILFFLAEDGVHGRELWRSDGTAKGTTLVVDVAAGINSPQFQYLVAGQGRAFFSVGVSDPSAGLWASDGTPGGTLHFPEVVCGGNAFFSRDLFLVLPSGHLIFTGSEAGPTNNWEVWISDGTDAGTHLLVDVNGTADSSIPRSFALLGDDLYFTAPNAADPTRRSYWRTDVFGGGTSEIPSPAGFSATDSLSALFAVVGETIFFRGWTAATGYEPFRLADGSVELVADVLPGPDSSIEDPSINWPYSNQGLFAASGGRALFLADDGVHGREFWSSDGTAAGTALLSSLTPDDSPPGFDPSLSLRAAPSVGETVLVREFAPGVGHRLWRIRANPDETTLVRNIGDQASSFLEASSVPYAYVPHGPLCLEAAGDRAIFEIFRVIDSKYWAYSAWGTDGTLAETEPLGIPEAFDPWCHSLGAEALLLQSAGGNGAQLFVSDATATGTQSIWAGSAGPEWGRSSPPFVPFYPGAAFAVEGAVRTTDGTSVETLFPVADFEPIALAATSTGSLYVADFELYRTDGQVGPPSPVADLNGDDPSYPGDLTALDDGSLLFSATDTGMGAELWRTDGTPLGTLLLQDIAAGPGSGLRRFEDTNYPSDGSSRVRSFGSGAAFVADDAAHGAELWITDGTNLGTHLLRDIYPGDYPSTPRNLTRFGDRVLFTAESEREGLELWATDGTLSGTAIVKDIAAGAASSIPDDLVVRDGILYFSAWSPNYGREAWMSDGTAAGTVRITDIAPGPASSSPQRFARAGNKLFFSATDQIHGYELWAIAYAPGSPLFIDGFENGSAIRWSEFTP